MPTYPNPAGGSMQAANDTEARAQGWNPSMGTFGANTYPGGGGGGGGGGGTSTYANTQAASMLLNQAQGAAQQAYYNAKLQLDSDQNAWQKAAQEAATVIAQAGVTGMYNGMPTQAAIKQAADMAQQQAQTMLSYAAQFGVWGPPSPGQQTLAAQQQAFAQNQQAAELTGWYTPYQYTPPQTQGNWSAVGTPSQATAQGATSGNMSWDALSNMMRSAAGDAYNDDAAKRAYQAATGADPNNFAGGTNVPISAQDLSNVISAGTGGRFGSVAQMTGQAAGQAPAQGGQPQPGQAQPQAGGTQYLGAPGGYTPGQGPVQTLAGQQQSYNQWLQAQNLALSQWQAQQGATQNYLQLLSQLRGPADWAQYQKVLGATPGGMQDLVRAAAGQYIPGGGATSGAQPQAASLNTLYNQATGQGGTSQQQLQNAQNTLVAPNQMAPQTWNALQPSQQQMLLGIWESQGYSQDDAKNLFNQSLPKYATQGPAAGSFRLQ